MLRQEQLSEQFEVSRTPVREALRRLAALGLVSFVPNRGVRVRTLSREELREAFLVRAELESLATELATPRITADGLGGARRGREALREADARAARAGHARARRTARSSASWVRANHAFHDVIYAAADAPFVERLAKSARRSFFTHVVWAAGLDIDHLYEQNDLQHRAIREAIAAGSAAGRARARPRARALLGPLLETILDQVRDRQASELRSAKAAPNPLAVLAEDELGGAGASLALDLGWARAEASLNAALDLLDPGHGEPPAHAAADRHR